MFTFIPACDCKHVTARDVPTNKIIDYLIFYVEKCTEWWTLNRRSSLS